MRLSCFLGETYTRLKWRLERKVVQFEENETQELAEFLLQTPESLLIASDLTAGKSERSKSKIALLSKKQSLVDTFIALRR